MVLVAFDSASVVEESFEYLDAPVERISAADVPMPYAANLERMAVPQVHIWKISLLLLSNISCMVAVFVELLNGEFNYEGKWFDNPVAMDGHPSVYYVVINDCIFCCVFLEET